MVEHTTPKLQTQALVFSTEMNQSFVWSFFISQQKERKNFVIFLYGIAYHKTRSKLLLLVSVIFTTSAIFLPPPFSAPVCWPIRKKQNAWSLSNSRETLSKNIPKLSVSLIGATDWQISQQFIWNSQLCFNFFFFFLI